jgi:hypothetical protein
MDEIASMGLSLIFPQFVCSLCYESPHCCILSPFPSVFESFDAMSPDVGVFGGDAESFVEWSGIAP